MPLGLVSSAQFDDELERLKTHEVKVEVRQIVRGRGNKLETPESVRAVIGEEVISKSDTIGSLAKQFNVSSSSASAYANGATSTASYNEPDQKLKKHIDLVKARIGAKARNRLISALDSITEDKLHEASLRDASAVAKDMSSIIKDMTPDSKSALIGNAERVLIYQPRMKEEEDYQFIHVDE